MTSNEKHDAISHDEASGESSPSPARVLYLDMNVWVDLARGCSASEPGCLRLRERLTRATRDNRIICPLSPAHYLELWHRRDIASRRTLAELMRDVTAYAAIPSLHMVRQREAQTLVRTWISPTAPALAAKDLLGRGAAHAFGRPDGRFRFVENVASADGLVAEGPSAEPPAGWEQFRKHPGWEWFQLFGSEQLALDELGFDRTPEHRFGTFQLDHEHRVREWLRSHPSERRRHRDMVVAEEFESVREYVETACREDQVRPPEPLQTGNWGPESAEAMRDLVRSMPSADVWATLRFLKHRDLNLPWEQHDWTDLWALSVAIPYCDSVVTEKRWAHLASAGELTRRYGTSVGHGLRAVEHELDLLEST